MEYNVETRILTNQLMIMEMLHILMEGQGINPPDRYESNKEATEKLKKDLFESWKLACYKSIDVFNPPL